MTRYAPRPKLLDKSVEMKQPSDITQRITATENLFQITHMAIAEVETESWRLTVGGMVENEQSMSLDDLRQFPQKRIESVHKCAGYPYARTIATRQVANVEWTAFLETL
jgi:DMSO/TMAO reductase YedYZ molybdopterin-dependent catalytic subunit